jgi:hypothetical protein
MPAPNTREYASRVIKRSVKHGLLSDAGSASSCPSSTSSSSASDAELAVKEGGTTTPAQESSRTRRRRRLLRLKYSLKLDGASCKLPALHFVVPHEKSREKSLVVLPGLLRRKKILKMEQMFLASPSRYVIDDRKSDLVYASRITLPSHVFAASISAICALRSHASRRYSHVAHRVEVCLRTECAAPYLR